MKAKTYRKILYLIVFLAFSFVIAPYLYSEAGDGDDDENDFSIKASASEDLENSTCDVVVNVTNNGKDFGGYVRLEINPSGSPGGALVYDSYVAVASGETAVVRISYPVMSSGMTPDAGDVWIRIVDKKENEVFAEKQKHLFDEEGDRQYGVLSMSGSSLNYIAGQMNSNYQYGYSSQPSEEWDDVYLMPTELTDGTLLSMTALIINDYDISTLPREAIEAIQSWTRRGGILVIGTGDTRDAAFDAFDPDFIDAKLGPAGSQPNYSYFSMTGYLELADIDYGSQYHNFVGSYPEWNEKPEGAGSIILLSLSLSDPDLDRVFTADVLTTEIRNLADNNSSVGGNHINSYSLQQSYGLLQGNRSINSVLLRIIILIYVVLIGPILYLILKKLDKREKIWGVIPAIALVFVLLVFFCSRGFRLQSREVSSVRVVPSDGSGVERDFVFGYNAAQKPWTVTAKGDYRAAGPFVMDRYRSLSASASYAYRTADSPDGMLLKYVPETAFDEAYFTMLAENSYSGGNLALDLRLENSKLVGSLQNNSPYDLDYVLLVCDGYYDVVKNVGSGDTLQIASLSRMSYTGNSLLETDALRYYNNEDYEAAGMYEALSLAAYELREHSCFAVGVTKKGEGLIADGAAEDSFLCLYATE